MPKAEAALDALAGFPDFESVVALIRRQRDVKLLIDVESGVHLVAYSPGRIEFRPADHAPADLTHRLKERLHGWTGTRWDISITTASDGAATIAGVRDADAQALRDRARAHPLVAAVLAALPGADVDTVRTPRDLADAAARDALPEAPDGADPSDSDTWDPFEDDRA